MSDYPAFKKIPRYYRDVVITEKIDGTNGLISIQHYLDQRDGCLVTRLDGPPLTVRAGSRNRWLEPLKKGADNFGFAEWVFNNARTLVEDLGEGLHYGEWYGQGIQRGYGLDHRRFALFNTKRWGNQQVPFETPNLEVVPVLYAGPHTHRAGELDEYYYDQVDGALNLLRNFGSEAVPGYRNPEGIVVFHVAAQQYFKVTVEHDAISKGEAEKLEAA